MIVEQQTWKGIMKIEVLSATEAIVDGERVRVCPAIRKEIHFTILDALVNRERKTPHTDPVLYNCPECDGYGVAKVAKVREPPPPTLEGDWKISGPYLGVVTVETPNVVLCLSKRIVENLLARFEIFEKGAEEWARKR